MEWGKRNCIIRDKEHIRVLKISYLSIKEIYSEEFHHRWKLRNSMNAIHKLELKNTCDAIESEFKGSSEVQWHVYIPVWGKKKLDEMSRFKVGIKEQTSPSIASDLFRSSVDGVTAPALRGPSTESMGSNANLTWKHPHRHL